MSLSLQVMNHKEPRSVNNKQLLMKDDVMNLLDSNLITPLVSTKELESISGGIASEVNSFSSSRPTICGGPGIGPVGGPACKSNATLTAAIRVSTARGNVWGGGQGGGSGNIDLRAG